MNLKNNVKLIFMILMVLSLVSCQEKVKTIEIIKSVNVDHVITNNENTWGLEFKSTPVKNIPQVEKELSKAVAYIDYAAGGSATGFFISEDGLFLTNEHVISRNECTRNECEGIRIIRDFHVNGEVEVFHDFEVLAHNSELDYALLKVKLPEGKKVPYLQLQNLNVEELGTDFFILGHPNGGNLRKGMAYLDANGSILSLRSIAISGNSGSPLINLKTGKVVGIYHSSSWLKGSINKYSGAVRHEGYASRIDAVLANIKMAYPSFPSVKEIIDTEETKDILPMENISTGAILESIHSSEGPNNKIINSRLLDTLQEESKQSVKVYRRSKKTIRFIARYNRVSKNKIKLTEESVEQIKKLNLFQSIYSSVSLTPILVDSGLYEIEECLRRVAGENKKYSYVYEVWDAVSLCGSAHLSTNDLAGQVLANSLKKQEVEAKPETYFKLLGYAVDTIDKMTHANLLSAEDVERLFSYVTDYAEREPNWSESMYAESVKTKMIHKDKLFPWK